MAVKGIVDASVVQSALLHAADRSLKDKKRTFERCLVWYVEGRVGVGDGILCKTTSRRHHLMKCLWAFIIVSYCILQG